MLRALATVSSLDARPLRPSEGKRSFPLISAGISLFIIHYSLLIINYHEKIRMEYHYQSDHRRSYRHRGSTWHPILYSLIFNFNYQFSIIMGKAYCFYQNYREVRLLVIHCSATRYDRDFPVEALRSSHKATGLRRYRVSFLYHTGRGITPLPTGQPDRGARSRMERQKYRYMLRGRTRRTGPSGRYPDLRPALYLDGPVTAITKGLPGGTHPRTLPIKPLHTQGLPLL